MFGSAASLARCSALAALALAAGTGSALAQETPASGGAPTKAEAAPDAQPLPIDWQGPEDCDRGDAVR
ncbi:MAG: hypothetical protein ABUL60_06690, partial [Myxococcales bacterium]